MRALKGFGVLFVAAGLGLLSGCGGAGQDFPPPAGLTAKAAFRAAAQVGRAWRPDARLVLVSATWEDPAPDRLRTGRGAWAFYFVSPGSQTALVVAVAGGRAEAAGETAVGPELEEVVFLDWKVDSDGALAAFLRAGGEGFLAGRPDVAVTARLLRPPDQPAPQWRITALEKGEGRTFQVQVDAADGTSRVEGAK